MKTIGLIGFGNMGGAIFSALQDSDLEYEFAIADKSEEKLSGLLLSGAKVLTSTDVNVVIEKSDIIIIAVKPQIFPDFCAEIKTSVSGKLFVSIMAGVNIKKITSLLGSNKVIRTMPNLPAMVQAGVTGFFVPSEISNQEKEEVVAILESFSFAVEVEEEDDLNKITALAGSAPAYFFYLTQILQKKATECGFDPEKARIIAETVFAGSAKAFLEIGDKSAEEWVQAVASKGGTTEAALKYMKENNFEEIFKGGVDSAIKRGQELSE